MSFVSSLVESLLSLFSAASEAPVVQWILRFMALSEALTPVRWTSDFTLHDGDVFDFVVVGAGSGGATVAARLSEISHWKVLLIEAGGDPPLASVVPSLFATLAHSKSDWEVYAKLDKGVGRAHVNNEIPLTLGNTLGGGSSVNFEIYNRGVPADYQEWNKVAPGWDWPTVLHYFKKLENMTDGQVFRNPWSRRLHSTYGPLKISRPAPNKYFQEINKRLISSFEEMGIKTVFESSGPDIFGATLPHFTFADGKRSSTAEAYLRPAKYRNNLFIAKNTRATKIIIDENTKQAYGVKVMVNGKDKTYVYAIKDVIISAGAINTPKLLMLSGIGPVEELPKLGIPVHANLPVGKNLQDHAVVSLLIKGKKGLDSAAQSIMTLGELGGFPVPIQTGFFNVNGTFGRKDRPSFEFFNVHTGAGAAPIIYFGCRASINFDDDFCLSMANANSIHEIDVIGIILLHPSSRGTVALKSSDPYDEPLVEMGYFRDQNDLYRLSEAVKFVTNLTNTSHFRKVKAEIAKIKVRGCEGVEWGTDEYWVCYVRNAVTTMFHPVGTCAMGDYGVVDTRLRVHGIENLRVVDASVMPSTVSGTTNIPTIMIGERAADLIKMDHL